MLYRINIKFAILKLYSIILLVLCCSNSCQKEQIEQEENFTEIKMTVNVMGFHNEYNDKVTIDMSGTDSVVIDWGDGTKYDESVFASKDEHLPELDLNYLLYFGIVFFGTETVNILNDFSYRLIE